MADSGLRAINRAPLPENEMPIAEMRQSAGLRRRVSKDERARVVAECHQPGACLTMVARRNRVTLESDGFSRSDRRAVRATQEGGGRRRFRSWY